MAARSIDVSDIVDVVKNGRKYSTIVKDQCRVVSVGYNKNGKLPSDCLVVVTDKTGNEIVTAHNVNKEEWIVDDLSLLRESHYADNRIELFDRWYGYFKDKVFDHINFLPPPAEKYKK